MRRFVSALRQRRDMELWVWRPEQALCGPTATGTAAADSGIGSAAGGCARRAVVLYGCPGRGIRNAIAGASNADTGGRLAPQYFQIPGDGLDAPIEVREMELLVG